MPTYTNLGNKLIQKYPDAYQGMDPGMLGAKLVAKYPDAYTQYADPAATAPAVGPAAPGENPAATPSAPPTPTAPPIMMDMGHTEPGAATQMGPANPDPYTGSIPLATAQPNASGYLSGLYNVLPSAVRAAGGLVQAVEHPITTAKNIASLPVGLVENGVSAAQQAITGHTFAPTAQQDIVNGLARSYFDPQTGRYGNWDNTKRTLFEDPFGALMDASAVLGGAGVAAGAVGAASDAAKLADVAKAAGLTSEEARTASLAGDPSVMTQAGNALKTAGSLVDPARAVGSVAKGTVNGASSIADRLAPGLYDNIVRTPTNQLQAGLSSIGSELYQRGIAGTYGMMNSKVQDLMDQSGGTIGQIKQQFGTVPIQTTPVVEALKALKGKLDSTPLADSSSADRALKSFLDTKNLTTSDIVPGSVTNGNAAVPGKAGMSDVRSVPVQGTPGPAGNLAVRDGYAANQASVASQQASNVASATNSYSFPKTLSLEDAQTLKHNLDEAISDSQHLKDSSDNVGVTQAQQTAADALRGAIIDSMQRAEDAGQVPKGTAQQLSQANQDYSFGIRARKALISASNNDPSVIVKAQKAASALSTIAAAGLGHPAIAAGIVGQHILTSPFATSELLQAPGKLASKGIDPRITSLMQRAAQLKNAGL